MSHLTFGIRELITRFQMGIPFGTKEQWENFGENYYVACYLFIDVMDNIGKYQTKIVESIISGDCNVVIWDKLITLDPNDTNVKHNYLIKALIDGNMSVYGYPEREFNNLQTMIRQFIKKEEDKHKHEADSSMFINYGLHNYQYRVNIITIDESNHLYQITIQLYQKPLENPVFDDLLDFGIGVQTEPQKNQDSIKSMLNTELKIDDIDSEMMKIIQHEMNEDGIELNLENI